jgi:hypothetical protein
LFDLVVSGQAWHWIDPSVGPQKAATILSTRGRLAIFWNVGTHDSETRSLLDEAYGRHAPALEQGYVPLGKARPANPDHIAAIVATGCFAVPEQRVYEWARVYSGTEWLDQLGTHSDHLLLPPDQFSALAHAVATAIDRLGGSITVHYQTELILARRI